LEGIDLMGDEDSEHEIPLEGESDGGAEETEIADLRAGAEAVQAPLEKLRAETLVKLPGWTE
jgi:hypothetical protein